MSLKDYQPEWQAVDFGGGEGFRVRGLSLNDLSGLMRSHLPDIQHAFKTYQAAAENDGGSDALILKLVQDAPLLSAHVIAAACGELGDEVAEAALNLPFPVQVDALIKTMNLTFLAVGGSKNFGAMLISLLKGFGLELPSTLGEPLAKMIRAKPIP